MRLIDEELLTVVLNEYHRAYGVMLYAEGVRKFIIDSRFDLRERIDYSDITFYKFLYSGNHICLQIFRDRSLINFIWQYEFRTDVECELGYVRGSD